MRLKASMKNTFGSNKSIMKKNQMGNDLSGQLSSKMSNTKYLFSWCFSMAIE